MIRINLLPQKKQLRRRGDAGAADSGGESQIWLAFVLGAVLLEVIVLLFVYKTKQDQLTQVQKHNTELSGNIENIKREISQHASIKAQLKELREREEAIEKLQAARTGPTAAMLELSRIMTPGRGPTIDRDKLEQLKRDNPSAVPNASWDPRRLSLVSYKETDRIVKLSGHARDGEDVSEFLRRLSLSDYFYEVKLLPASKGMDSTTKLELVKFEMSAKARY
ncbi:MAG TPA: PilN domain-containing protein [Labilithrix sp.]|jgi:type IV pilus assembly protein PilN|nr:PilN domain-containing protein [Labilithrix sp.]